MNSSNRGLIGTLIFHTLILLIFILFGFSTPLPLPGEQGILINFGDSETGLGKLEPKINDIQANKKQVEEQQNSEEPSKTNEGLMTQDFEEAPAVKTAEKPKIKETEKKKEKPVTAPKPEVKKTEAPKVEQPVVNQRALYKGKNANTNESSSEGVAGGTGNQGGLTGSENATDHSLGTGSGTGTSFSLIGRNPLSLPTPDIETQKEGKVVVEIKVDREGNIVSAVPGVKGSTTLDSYLCNVAKNYALRSKFDSKPDAPYNQIGTITYVFKLK